MKFDEGDVDRIKALSQRRIDDGILSVYLPIDPAVAIHRGHVALLMDLLQELRGSAPERDRARIDEEGQVVLGYVREGYTPHGSALIVFSGVRNDYFEVFSWQVQVPALVRFGPRPYVAPVEVLLRELPQTLIVLADEREARLLRLMLGQLVEVRRVRHDVPPRQRQGGWAAAHYEQDREQHIETHFKDLAAKVEKAQKEKSFEYLVLAGSDETTAALAADLGGDLRPLLAGTFRAEMFEPDSVVIDRASTVVKDAAGKRERELVQSVLEQVGGGGAVLGAHEMLQALDAGRVRTAVISDHMVFSPRGEMAWSLARATDAEIEVVHGEAAEALDRNGGIGGLLRY